MNHVRSTRLVSGSTNVAVTNTFIGDSEFAFDGDIAATLEEQLAVAIDPAEIQSLMISGGGKGITVCTNDAKAGSPTDVLIVPNGHVFVWAYDDQTPNPFTAPITSFYISNDDPVDTASVKLRILLRVVPVVP